jgi:hypothetical protein
MKSKVWKRVLIGSSVLVLLLVLVGIFIGNFFYDFSLNRAGSRAGSGPVDEVAARANSDLMQWMQQLDAYSSETIQSFDGLQLQGYRIRAKTPSNKWVVLVHGYGNSANGMVAQAKYLHSKGFNLLIPDARGHGLSEGDYIGMGWHERRDIVEWSNTIVADNQQAEIALYGVSMGGATVMMASGEADLPTQVRAIVEDCGYSSILAEFTHQLDAQFHLGPFPVMNFSSLVTRVRAGFWLGEGDVVKQVQKSTRPMLFIHGTADDYVPTAMVEDVYNAANTPKEKLLVTGAAHAKSLEQDPALYWATIEKFLAQHLSV